MPLLGRGCINLAAILRLVGVDNHVAFLVEGFLEQPFEDASVVSRVGNLAVVALTVDAGDVLFRDGLPIDIARHAMLPALDAGKEPLNAWAVPPDDIHSIRALK